MSLKDPILAIVNKIYEPSTMVERKFGRYDLAFKTDSEGRPILLFIGKKNEQGQIVGDRYSRRLKTDDKGNPIKDHWERKGKSS
ncbi:hypothetical protein BC792_10580 [Sphingobacterium allocomposti]|uniref:Uncharacterized protein n=1 Tax=Sphingobacterium allocomposti TaxID=415956 RepID=A0A5S5DPG6_9SPHI|nr:hypothetical protein [Sphingobacterium composti Yoo et al. 2007 non Ten et al. 2007]TYP96589.1 hypothetical protein BC792_10580 [Sphingobacterium composti Yoo et al. 2007 non Ten et al. 2007]HLS96023.1 hypothetical protein [Sphingobacterium sp.]